MFSSSLGIAFTLAVAIAALTLSFLSYFSDAPQEHLLLAAGFTFFFALVILTLVLEFLIFNEITQIYDALAKIQNKDLKKIAKKTSKTSLFPLRKINRSINDYVRAKNKEIETLQKNETFRKEFIADISHELKTPIFTAQGYIHTLLDGALDDQNVRYTFLTSAAKNLNTLEKLVQDILTLNKIESGMVKFQFEMVELKEVITEAMEQLEHKAEQGKVTVRFEVNREESYQASADRDKISHAVQNLVSNAIKYNHPGGEVKISLKKNKKSITVEVADNGKGIPQDDLKRIFERFYRVEKSRSREKGGTGLGLAIVKHILEGHNSKISVSSQVDKGTVFSFSLPLPKSQKKEKASPYRDNK